MRRRQIAEIGPQRIGGDVGGDHGLCPVSRRPARTHRRADDGAIDCLSVGFWQAGGCAVPQAVGARVKQKDRTERTTGQFFDEQACAFEDELARIAPGYHLEKAFLPGQQHLGPLSLGDVRRATHEFRQITRWAQNRMADGVDIFDRAVWKKDPEFHLVIRLFSDGSIDCPLPLNSILRMNAPQPFFPSRHALFWIEAIYAVPFLGQMQGLSSRYPPGPTPRVREALRFRQITLAPPQGFYRLIALDGDTRKVGDPLYDILLLWSGATRFAIVDREGPQHPA